MKRFKIYYSIYSAIACCLLITVPYLFPQSEPVQSTSYNLGFNNGVGILMLVALCGVAVIYGIANSQTLRSNISTDFWNLKSPVYGSRKILRWAMIITVVLIGILCVICCFGEFYGATESTYFIRYVYCVVYGVNLYSDVQYIYGLLYVYPVVWLHELGLSVTVAYFLVLTIYQLLGLLTLYYILGHTNLSEKEKNFIFIYVAVFLFPWSTGLNYNLLRAVMSLGAFVTMISKERKVITQALLVLALVAFVVLSSPEHGLCLALATIIYYTVVAISRKRYANLLFAAMPIVTIGTLYAIYPLFLSYIFQMGGGGSNFPYIPSLPVILFFASLFVISVAVGVGFRKFSENIETFALIFLICEPLPAALGRADPGHLIFNCMFVFVIGYFTLLHWFSPRYVRIAYFVSTFVFIFYTLRYTIPGVAISVAKSFDRTMIINIMENYAQTSLPFADRVEKKCEKLKLKQQGDLKYEELFKEVTTATSINIDTKAYVYLCENTSYKDTYFAYRTDRIGRKEGFDREIEELRRINAEYLVLPKDYVKTVLMPEKIGYINTLFATYYPVKPYRQYAPLLYTDLVNYITSNYSLYRKSSSIDLYKRNK